MELSHFQDMEEPRIPPLLLKVGRRRPFMKLRMNRSKWMHENREDTGTGKDTHGTASIQGLSRELPFGSTSKGINPAGDRLQSLTFSHCRPLMLELLCDLPTA